MACHSLSCVLVFHHNWVGYGRAVRIEWKVSKLNRVAKFSVYCRELLAMRTHLESVSSKVSVVQLDFHSKSR